MKHNGDINIETIEKGNKKRVYNRLIIPTSCNTPIPNTSAGSSAGPSSSNPNLDLENSASNASSSTSCPQLSLSTTPFSLDTTSFVQNDENMLDTTKSTNIDPPSIPPKEQPATIPIPTVAQQHQLIQLLNQKPKHFQCNECPYGSPCRSQLENHSTIHRESTATNTQFEVGQYKDQSATTKPLPFQHNQINMDEQKQTVKEMDITDAEAAAAIDLRTVSNEKLLMFCQYCPARFVSEREINLHRKMHASWFPYRCSACTYTSRQESYIETHAIVHSTEYQDKTKCMLAEYNVHDSYLQPSLSTVRLDEIPDQELWIVAEYRKGLLKPAPEAEAKDLDLDDVITSSKVPNKIYNHSNVVDSLQNRNSGVVSASTAVETTLKETGSIQVKATMPTKRADLSHTPQPQAQKQVASPQPSSSSIRTTIEKQILKIQEYRSKSSVESTPSTPSKSIQSSRSHDNEEKCPHCPFTTRKANVLKEHMYGHICVSGIENLINCDHCDYSVADEPSLKQHVRLHFTSAFTIQPSNGDCSTSSCELSPGNGKRKTVAFFTSYDTLVLSSICAGGAGSTDSGGNALRNDDLPKTIFPLPVVNGYSSSLGSSDKENKIVVDISTGETIA